MSVHPLRFSKISFSVFLLLSVYIFLSYLKHWTERIKKGNKIIDLEDSLWSKWPLLGVLNLVNCAWDRQTLGAFTLSVLKISLLKGHWNAFKPFQDATFMCQNRVHILALRPGFARNAIYFICYNANDNNCNNKPLLAAEKNTLKEHFRNIMLTLKQCSIKMIKPDIFMFLECSKYF